MSNRIKNHLKFWIVALTLLAVWLLGCTESVGDGVKVESRLMATIAAELKP